MITLVKIWNTEKDELINIVKENEHIHFNNRIINEDYNKGLKTNNFKYIHFFHRPQRSKTRREKRKKYYIFGHPEV